IILGLAAYAIMEPDRVRRFFTGRQARYGSNTLVMVLAFLGILIVGNVLAYENPIPVADLTEDKSNTLSPELLNVVKNLPQKVTATGFFSQSSTDTADKLLSKIKSNSNGKFDYHFENPDQNPLAAKEAGITGDGKILFQMGDRKEIAAFADEKEILQTLDRLLNPNPRAVYFLIGHGEAGVEQSGETSLSTAKQTLESKNYTVKSLNLIADGKIPEDALAIIIAGPKKPVSDREVSILKDYVNKGGSLVIMEDPVQFTDFGDAKDPLADYLVSDWGIKLDNDVIIDLSNQQQPLFAVSAIASQQHAITQNINANLIIIMPQARSISFSSQPKDVTQTSLIETAPPDQASINSWGETNLTSASGGQIAYDEGKDILGPLNMAVTGENTKTKGRVVVFGNSIFATDQGFNAYGNGNFFINSIDWAAEQEELIKFTPKTPTERTFKAPGQFQWIAILLGSVFIIPGLVVLWGVSTWLARRRQG
ncbi:MAG TPA: GldG family protein, partial [Anaerolineales bacterium]|nr:GldG family protein [Anaerolineales bacterium]